MPNYKALYHILFNEISETIARLEKIQQLTEEIYSREEPTVLPYPEPPQAGAPPQSPQQKQAGL